MTWVLPSFRDKSNPQIAKGPVTAVTGLVTGPEAKRRGYAFEGGTPVVEICPDPVQRGPFAEKRAGPVS
jgi:hypothetical protein